MQRQPVTPLRSRSRIGFSTQLERIGTGRGASWRQDIERISAVREAIGPDAELYVDANGAYDRTQARRLGLRFAQELGVTWFEEPVTVGHQSALRGTAAACGALWLASGGSAARTSGCLREVMMAWTPLSARSNPSAVRRWPSHRRG